MDINISLNFYKNELLHSKNAKTDNRLNDEPKILSCNNIRNNTLF